MAFLSSWPPSQQGQVPAAADLDQLRINLQKAMPKHEALGLNVVVEDDCTLTTKESRDHVHRIDLNTINNTCWLKSSFELFYCR